jgi:sugar phosphate isomerase/epimerase
MGSRYFIVSGVGDFTTKGLRAYEEAADRFNKAGRAFASAGVLLCYHNHSFEFQKFDGVRALDRLYELTDVRYVKLCVDTYWVRHGGEDPVQFVRRHLDRIATVHLKDFKAGAFAEVGEGEIDFAAVLEALRPISLEWVTVEQDETTRTPRESIALSRRTLRERFGL